MSDAHKVFARAIPEIYDRLLVSILFEPYAADLAGRAARQQPQEVLETAAGTGVLTRPWHPCCRHRRRSPAGRMQVHVFAAGRD